MKRAVRPKLGKVTATSDEDITVGPPLTRGVESDGEDDTLNYVWEEVAGTPVSQ